MPVEFKKYARLVTELELEATFRRFLANPSSQHWNEHTQAMLAHQMQNQLREDTLKELLENAGVGQWVRTLAEFDRRKEER